jgi:hypothetical protein
MGRGRHRTKETRGRAWCGIAGPASSRFSLAAPLHVSLPDLGLLEGAAFDCDFNLGQGLHLGSVRRYMSEMASRHTPGAAIVIGHCYVCTAGAGFA